jgi:Gpi18-like mannosyltransferase
MFKKITVSFLIWRVWLFFIAFLSIFFIPTFGARFPYADRVLEITNLPYWIWGFGNFDGVHFLRLAQNGYNAEFTQAFFPLYPLLIRFLNFFPRIKTLDLNIFTDPSYFLTAIILSTVFFLLALYFLFKLWGEEYNKKTAFLSILLLLSFPTAFYFGATYSESLFLLLVVLTFWFSKKNKYVLAGLTALLASATKIQGTILFIFLAIELWQKYRNNLIKPGKQLWYGLVGLFISPLGLVAYMYYLYKAFGNAIYFLTAQPAFGAERSSLPLVLLPQVIYRYIKMLLTLSPSTLAFWNAKLELTITLILVVGLIFAFKKIKFSYWIYAALAILLPTLTGTLSSMPRYALLAFPLLPLIAKFNKASRYIIIAQVLIGTVLLALFIRGYWVA